MKRIHYASGSLLTGDAIAEVLVRYAAALAENEAAAEVRAPALGDDGGVHEVLLLIGPASQMLAEDEASEHPDVINEEFVEACDRKINALGPQRAGFVKNGAIDDAGLDLDYL